MTSFEAENTYPDTASQMGGGPVSGSFIQNQMVDGRAGLRSNREETRPQKKMFGQANNSSKI
jgi:hypothetical protein